MWYIVSRRLTYMKHGSRYPDKPVGCRMFHRLLLSRWSWLWWSGWCSAPCPPAPLHTALLSWGSCRCWSGHPGRAPNLPPVKINRTSWVALESNNTETIQDHTVLCRTIQNKFELCLAYALLCHFVNSIWLVQNHFLVKPSYSWYWGCRNSDFFSIAFPPCDLFYSFLLNNSMWRGRLRWRKLSQN